MTKIELLPTDIQKFNVTDATIAEYKTKFMPLTVKGLEDKEGLKAVHDARMVIVKKRTEVERVRKELKADALEYGRQVDGEAKRITTLLEPIESHLSAEEQKIEDEKAKIKAEAEQRETERINARIEKLIAHGMNYNGTDYFLPGRIFDAFIITPSEIKISTDAEFDLFLDTLRIHNDKIKAEKAEQLRLEQEEKIRLEKIALEQKIEQDRLDKIAKEQADQAAKIKAEQEKIDAEKKRIEDQKLKEIADKKRREEIKEAEKRATEKALAMAELKRKKEEEAKAAEIIAEQKRLKRAEALKPDREKLIALADNVDKHLEEILPKIKSQEANELLGSFITGVSNAIRELKIKATELK